MVRGHCDLENASLSKNTYAIQGSHGNWNMKHLVLQLKEIQILSLTVFHNFVKCGFNVYIWGEEEEGK